MALAELEEAKFIRCNQEILQGSSHGFVTSVNYREFSSVFNLNQRFVIQSHGLIFLSSALLNSSPAGFFRETAKAENLISQDIWPWDPKSIGQVLFNWWDD